MDQEIKIFTIYTSEDAAIMLQLLGHLKPFKEDFNLSIWHNDPISHGQQWKPQIESRLQEADIFLLLVSDAFMNSEFIKQLEFKNIIDRYKDGTATVIPIILEDCQWQIDFKSDDYDFNLNELQVLPEGGKVIADWNPSDQAFNNIALGIKRVIDPSTEYSNQEESQKEEEQTVADTNKEEQIAINFIEESKAKALAKEEKKSKEEAEVKRKAEEEIRLHDEAEVKKRVEEEKRSMAETEAKKRAEEQQRIEEEAEAKRKTEKENRLGEEEEKAFMAEAPHQIELDEEDYGEVEETEHGNGSNIKKRIFAGLSVAVLAILGIWAFSVFNSGSKSQPSPLQEADTVEVKGPVVLDEAEMDPPKENKVLSNLVVGDVHDGGFVFEIDDEGKTGKIAHFDDAGPMPWKDAMKIDEELGEGWRLPTFNELRLMQKTIGQGATNNGEFSDGLYWSATPYDENQARLVRFRDGNTSYHYNSGGIHRKFLVRAIRDFSR